MFQMMNEGWFHGDIDQKEAYSLLNDKPIGSYLVRFSSRGNSFVVSCVVRSDRQAVRHFRVQHTRSEEDSISKFTIEGMESSYGTMNELIRENEHVFKIPVSAAPTRYR